MLLNSFDLICFLGFIRSHIGFQEKDIWKREYSWDISTVGYSILSWILKYEGKRLDFDNLHVKLISNPLKL